MRDDIHKGAPVRPSWRSFIKHSASDADWNRGDMSYAEKAVTSIAKDLRPTFIDLVRKTITDPQASLPGPMESLESIYQKIPLHRTEGLVVEHLIECGRLERPTEGNLKNSIVDAIQETIEAHFRSVDGHTQVKFPRERPELLRRMKCRVSEVSIQQIADGVLNKAVAQKPAHTKSFDLDENLRSPG